MSSAGRCMACSTSSGIVVGPGMARNCRPARTVIVNFPAWMWRPCWHAAAQFQRAPGRSIHAELYRVLTALIPDGLGDLPPDLILDLGRQRAGKDVNGRGVFAARLDQPQDPHFAIGVIEVVAAI